MIIKTKEKQKYIKIYDLDMKLIGSFYTGREASAHIGAAHGTIFGAMNSNIPLYNKYYVKTEGPSHIEHTKKVDSYTILRKYHQCRKCGITLCEKNEFLTASSSCRKKGIKHRSADCRQCIKKTNYCNIKYDDPVLNELCKKQAVVQYNKVYPKKHREAIRKNARITSMMRDFLLTDSVVISRLVESEGIKRILGRKIKKSEITPSMIDAKRKHILLTRKLKNQML